MMKMYDTKCPVCGKVNRNLFLDETDGWYECEQCGYIAQDEEYCDQERPEIWKRKITPLVGAHVS